jgi:hypothetical protein
MSKIMIWCTGLALAGMLAGCGQPAAVRTVGLQGGAIGLWGKVIELPGLGALSTGKHGYARGNSVSCASANHCAAGGYYADADLHDTLAIVPIAAQLRRRRGLHRSFRAPPGIRHPGQLARRGRLSGSGGQIREALTMKRLWPAILAVSAAVTGAGAVAPAWLAAQGPVAVWTGRRMIEWGGSGRTDGAVYTPALAAVSWGKAIAVPGLAALNTGGDAAVGSVSCASAGNCAAGGDYTGASGDSHGFVASERHGRWGTAIEVPGLAVQNTGGDAQVSSVSCASEGSCAAGGYYSESHAGQGFVASEQNGRWGQAIAVPGLTALNTGRDAEVSSVSCASAGNCAAGGYYSQGELNRQGFVAVERDGVWGHAIQVPGLAALNKDQYAEVYSVSCAPAGSCAAGGYYTYGGGNQQGFVAVERNGRWGKAIQVPGLAALNTGGNAGVSSVSCPSAASCAVGGGYTDRRGKGKGFVAVERNGRWDKAIQVPGLAALNKVGREAPVLSVSCARAGSCAGGGHYSDRPGHGSWYVAVEGDGRWGKAIQVPGLRALSKGTGGFDIRGDYFSVSCAPAGSCAAGGYYTDRHGHVQGFVTQTG